VADLVHRMGSSPQAPRTARSGAVGDLVQQLRHIVSEVLRRLVNRLAAHRAAGRPAVVGVLVMRRVVVGV